MTIEIRQGITLTASNEFVSLYYRFANLTVSQLLKDCCGDWEDAWYNYEIVADRYYGR